VAITDPTDISGLVGWYDASDTGSITHSSTFVTRWDDLSGNGHDVGMGNTTFSPVDGDALNGVTTVKFQGNDFLTMDPTHGGGFLSPAHTATTLTWFGVFKWDSVTEAYGRIMAMVNGAGDLNYNSDGFWALARDGSDGSKPVTYRNINHMDPGSDLAPVGTWVRVMVRFTGANAYIYVDGTQVATVADTRAFNFQDYVVGYLSEGAHFCIAEHGWYSTSLTTGELTDLDDYLDGKWFGTAPSAPRGLSVSAGYASGSLNVWWEPPASDGGVAISDYVIQYRTSAGPGSWSTFSDGTSTATGTTITGLSNGTAYDVQVAAVNSIGTSSYSSTVGPTTPSAPASITVAPTVAMPAPSYRI
jgi:hypothetical protein